MDDEANREAPAETVEHLTQAMLEKLEPATERDRGFYRLGLIHALRHVLEHMGRERPYDDVAALLAHVEEHGELPKEEIVHTMCSKPMVW